MNITDILAQAQNGNAMQNIGQRFGLDEAQTRAAVDQLAPMIAAGLRRNARNQSGLSDLLSALQQGNHERYYRDPAALGDAREEGNGILGHIFGSREVSREVANHASGETGIGADILKKMLPIIASVIMGSLSNRTREPGLQDIIGDVLDGALGGGGSSRGGAGGGILGSILGGLLRGARDGSRGRSRPSNQPGLEDIFGDILGGGLQGGRAPSGSTSTRSAAPPPSSAGDTTADDLLEAVLRRTRR